MSKEHIVWCLEMKEAEDSEQAAKTGQSLKVLHSHMHTGFQIKQGFSLEINISIHH